jgi:hypothetical protein
MGVWRGLCTEAERIRMAILEVLPSLKVVHYRVSVHKALHGLLREAGGSGCRSLVEIPKGSCKDHSMGSKVVEDEALH